MNDLKKIYKVILFCDIHNFSKICIVIKDKYPFFIQDFYQEIGQLIIDFNGEIIKYVGDMILTIFPKGTELNTIKCAKKMRIKYRDILLKYDLKKSISELEIGIGSGKIFLGVFGHESLKLKDVFGIKVNETAMIAHHRGIAITEDVYKKIKNKIEVKYLKELKVKWDNIPLKIWEVVKA